MPYLCCGPHVEDVYYPQDNSAPKGRKCPLCDASLLRFSAPPQNPNEKGGETGAKVREVSPRLRRDSREGWDKGPPVVR
jgi:hypothetical protein